MKKIIVIITLILTGFNPMFSQTINPFGSYTNFGNNIFIWIKDTNYYEISKAVVNDDIDTNNILHHNSTVGPYEIISRGNIKIDSSNIILFDTLTNTSINLVFISEEKLLCINSIGDYLNNGDTLYVMQKLTLIPSNGSRKLKYIGHWNQGKKNGLWMFFYSNDSIVRFYYKNDTIINIIKTKSW